jgi:hypothetical protein
MTPDELILKLILEIRGELKDIRQLIRELS